jgi:peptide/nickel transport system permease protein
VQRSLIVRIAQAVLVVALVATLAFFLLHAAPGDPLATAFDDPQLTESYRAAERARFGIDRPLGEQYVRWLSNYARGDFGWSYTRGRPVAAVLADAIPNTLLLSGLALVLGVAGGLALGTWQAARRGSAAEHASDALGIVVLSSPEFLLSLGALSLFAIRWRLFPASGMVDAVMHDSLPLAGRIADVGAHLALPTLTLAVLSAVSIARYHRSAMLAVIPEDFMRTARAKGANERQALLRHALPNAIGPVITIAGLLLPTLVGGSVIVEKVFAWPGVGLLMIEAIGGRDYPLVLAGVVCTSALVVLGALIADLAVMSLDPRRARDV